MNLYVDFNVSRETYCDLYRLYHRERFHLSRLLYVCIFLYLARILLKIYSDRDFEFGIDLSLILLVIGTLLQFVREFVFAKVEYNTKEENGLINTSLTITDDYIMYGEGIFSESSMWTDYIKCIEKNDAFLLMKKTSFDLIMKDSLGDHIDEVRLYIMEHVNKGKVIKRKK